MITITRDLLALMSRAQRWRLAYVLVLVVVAGLLEAVSVGLVLPFVGLVSDPSAISSNAALSWAYRLAGSPDPKHFIVMGAVGISLLFIVRNAYLAVVTLTRQRFVFELYRSLAARLMRCFQHRAYIHTLSRNSADFVRVIMQDAVNVASGAVDPILVIATEIIVSGGLVVLMVVVRPLETLLTFAVFGAALMGMAPAIRRYVAALAEISHHTYTDMLKWANQSAGGVREATVLGRRQYFVDHFQAASRRFANARASYLVFKDVPRLVMEAMAVVVIMGMVIVLVLQDQSPGEIMPFLAMVGVAAFRIMPSATRVYAAIISLRFANPQLQAVKADIAGARSEGIDVWLEGDEWEPLGAPALPFTESLVLEDVCYRYPGAERPALDGISITVPRGGSIAIVGPSGGGKTTLIGILLGLLEPQQGSLLVDGRPVTSDLAAWRRRIGYIPQDIYLLDASIRANVAFGIPLDAIDASAVDRAIEAAQLAPFIQSLPEGLDTFVGERGVRLSGGQRQRIAIARALYHDPDLLLLDEATAALDNQTEREVCQAIDELAGKKTSIIVAHRLTTIRNCDTIYFVKDGRVAASGSYDELLKFDDFRRMAVTL